MARIIPSDISRLALGHEHARELDTLAALEQGLPDDYTVFHSVHWSLENGKKNQFGEIDFVVVNGSGKAVVIEQKNGALEETEWGLVKRYGEDGKSVGEQVHRSLDAIRDKFKRHNGTKNKFSLDYLIYCPDHKVENLNAPGLDAIRIVEARDRDRLGAKVVKLLESGDSKNKEHAKAVRDFFCQSFEVVPDVHAYIDAQQRSYTRLSGGLVSLIDNLEMTPFRLRVHGTAGCGKSQAARHFFDKAVAQGKRPLLVCFNRPLSERLKANVGDGGAVYTLYGLYDTFLKQKGHQLDYAQMNEDPSFWKKAAELVVASEVPEHWKFDVVIVDEGQDFGPESYEMLRCFMKDNADLLWLEDPTQNLRQTSAVSGDDFIIYNAKENYRTTRNISKFIEKTMPFEFECTNGLPGLGVRVTTYEKPEDQKKLVDEIVRELMKKGFANKDIVVLTCRGVQNSVFSEAKQLGGLPARRFTGEYDSQGNQVFTEGKIYFDSVYRFKGQQAPAVVLVDVDPDSEKQNKEQRVLFCGMSRATMRLEMVVNSKNPANKAFVDYR